MTKRAISLRPVDRILEFLAIATWLFSIALILWYYSELPDTIAIHFSAQGKADGWADKGTAVVVPLAFSIGVFLISIVSRYVPKDQMNYPGNIDSEKRDLLYPIARTMMHGIQLAIGLISTYAVYQIVNVSLHGDSAENTFDIWVILLSIFTPIIIYFYYYFKIIKE